MGDFQRQRAILQEMRDNEELVNGTILTDDGGEFKVHLEVLAAMSPYFQRIIVLARDKPWESILIPNTSKDVVSNIIDFMYTGQLLVSLDKVDSIAKTAEFLEMPEIIKLCHRFLVSAMDKDNCILIYSFAKRFGYTALKQQARSYLMLHFQQIFPVSCDYLNLSADDLLSVLSSDALNVKEEEYVYWAVMRWFENEPSCRAVYLPSLLRCIRFGLVDSQFYERNIRQNTYLSSNDECQAVILQASQVFEDMPNGDRLFDVRHPFLRPRTPSEVLFVMGGWSAGSATNVIETFDVNVRRWFLSLLTDSIPRAYHGMLWHQGYIYVIGGFDGNQCFNSVRRYDPVSHVWEEKGCMFVQRCYVSVAAVGDCIYAMGGYDGHRRNKSCERYEPKTNQWTKVASMNQVRSDASADALHGKVYIAGGFNGSAVLSSAESYDPQTDEWTLISTMNSPRSGVKLVAYCDYLYVIGGFNGSTRLASVEKYDPRTKMWLTVPNMSGQRSNFAAAVMGGCLYVVGGFNGLSTVSSAECFDQQQNRWREVTELNLNRSALAACTVSGIPNAHQYTFLDNHPIQ